MVIVVVVVVVVAVLWLCCGLHGCVCVRVVRVMVHRDGRREPAHDTPAAVHALEPASS